MNPRAGDRFLGISGVTGGIVWELTTDPIGLKCKALLVSDGGDTWRIVGEEYFVNSGLWFDLDHWRYLGNFGKSNKFKSLYEKLSS